MIEKMYQVRFHLAAGKNCKKWQVKRGSEVKYYSPSECSLLLTECLLHANLKRAEKVHESQKRDVCGWVLCKKVEVIPCLSPPGTPMVHFDPKVEPHWRVEGSADVWDGKKIPGLVSYGRRFHMDYV